MYLLYCIALYVYTHLKENCLSFYSSTLNNLIYKDEIILFTQLAILNYETFDEFFYFYKFTFFVLFFYD